MYPAVLIPYIGHLEEIFIQTFAFKNFPEDRLVGPWRTGRDNNLIDNTVIDVLTNDFLTRIRTHEQVLPGYNHIRQGLRMLADGLNIDDTADIGTTMTDIHSNFCHVYLH